MPERNLTFDDIEKTDVLHSVAVDDNNRSYPQNNSHNQMAGVLFSTVKSTSKRSLWMPLSVVSSPVSMTVDQEDVHYNKESDCMDSCKTIGSKDNGDVSDTKQSNNTSCAEIG